jgi:hypothetical protein
MLGDLIGVMEDHRQRTKQITSTPVADTPALPAPEAGAA